MNLEKCCTHCSRTLPVDEFYTNNKGTHGRTSRCKACTRELYHHPKPRNDCSLIREVIDLVNELGEVTGDDLCPHCPSHTRQQVITALQNARATKRIRLVRRGAALGKGSAPGVYGPLEPEPAEPLPPLHQRPPSSVWELGERAGASA